MLATQVKLALRHTPQSDIFFLIKRSPHPIFLLTLFSTLATLALVYTLGYLPVLLDSKTVVITTDSMAPTLKAGDAMIITQPPNIESIRVGDIITFDKSDDQGLITHRVMAIQRIEGTYYFTTKGDANLTPDPHQVSVESLRGKTVLTIPIVGYLLRFASTLLGAMVLVGAPLLVWLLEEIERMINARTQSYPSSAK